MKTVLVVDDERQIAEIARDYLQHAGFGVMTASDGAQALELARARHPDLIVLDLGLPTRDGLDVARTLRRESNVPIIMLTARVDESDRLLGLEIGADDYVTKPFSPRELVARVQAVLRRAASQGEQGDVFRFVDLTIDVSRLTVKRGDRPIDLTPTEFQLLAVLMAVPGRVYSRGELLERLQGELYVGVERTIDVHIRNLRKKIEPDPTQPRYIRTVFGIGYRASSAEELGSSHL